MIENEVRKSLKYPVFTAEELEFGRSKFVETDRAVAVVANRYDGIDFPNDDCRLLFVEGLPKATNLQERFLMNRMGHTSCTMSEYRQGSCKRSAGAHGG